MRERNYENRQYFSIGCHNEEYYDLPLAITINITIKANVKTRYIDRYKGPR